MAAKAQRIADRGAHRRLDRVVGGNIQITVRIGLLVAMVGGMIPSRMAMTQAIASIAPAAPSRCPVIDFVESILSW